MLHNAIPLVPSMGICNPLGVSLVFHGCYVFVARILFFLKASDLRIKNAAIHGWLIANPPEREPRSPSFLQHLVRISLSVLHRDLHHVLPGGQALQAEAFKSIALRAHQAALQVVELHELGLYVGRVVDVQ